MIKRKRIFAITLLIALFIQSTICIAATKSTEMVVSVSGASTRVLAGSYSKLVAYVDKASIFGKVTNNTNNSRYITVSTTRYKNGVADGTRSNKAEIVPGGDTISSGSVARISTTTYSYYVTCTVYNSVSSSTGAVDSLTIKITQNGK